MAQNPREQQKPGSGGSAFGAVFAHFARWVAHVAGTPWMFVLASAVVTVWAFLGPRFRYSDTWQLVINTGTTIVTFLMVFVIQNTQNRDSRALHLKLDEVIRSIRHAHNELIDIENLSDEELGQLAERYEKIRAESEARRQRRRPKPSAA
ncbi:MAG TPA: low affinity iron permease family protein [Terriglobales bacterium]|nr:low affinity iron permease family protein [Terriglobales bacterium]